MTIRKNFKLILSLSLLIASFFPKAIFGQYWIAASTPSQISSCQELTLEFRLYNDGDTTLPPSELFLPLDTSWTYIQGSVEGATEKNDPVKTLFIIPAIEPCEHLRILVVLNHECTTHDLEYHFSGIWTPTGQAEVMTTPVFSRVLGLKLSMSPMELYYDSTDHSFYKKYTVINTGKVNIRQFVLYISGEDNMTILSTNLGRLSADGDTLYLDGQDFSNIGNNNQILETGEHLEIIQKIDLNACDDAKPFEHVIRTDCGTKTCVFNVASDAELVVKIGTPRIYYLRGSEDTLASPCNDGKIHTRLYNFSTIGSFPEANAMYNVVLNTGWSLVRNNRRTSPQKDNCLPFIRASVEGTNIPLITVGFSGYGLDFTRLTSDPDGPGGLSDLDGDGRFDDLLASDTIDLIIEYRLPSGCLNFRCGQSVFESHLLLFEATYDNFCMEEGESSAYLSHHNYLWAKNSGYLSKFLPLYAKGDQDTISFQVAPYTSGFFNHCKDDSLEVRITFPRVVDLPNNAIILANGDTIPYRFRNQVLTMTIASNRANISVPILLDCDPNQGGGIISTPCVLCGKGLPQYRFFIEADYRCNDDCYGTVPMICNQSSAFGTLCDSASVGISSESQIEVLGIFPERKTIGYVDSTKMKQASPDSIQHHGYFIHDTFLLHIPFDIKCEADFENIILRLVQPSSIRFMNNTTDTSFYFDLLTDTLKYFNDIKGTWTTCENILGNPYFSQNVNLFYRQFIHEANISNLPCIDADFHPADSMVIVVKGVVRNSFTNNLLSRYVRAHLQYRQDDCESEDEATLTLNLFSGIPNGGNYGLSEPYQKDSNYTRRYSTLSVCGPFELFTTLDNFYITLDTADYFVHEYRQPMRFDSIRFTVPKFFEIQIDTHNFIKEFYTISTNQYERDSTTLLPRFKDSMEYTILTFEPPLNNDFLTLRHYLKFYLNPNCYSALDDSIKIYKYARIQMQGSQALARDTVIKQSMRVQVAAISPVVTNPIQQFLGDARSITYLDLFSGSVGHTPESYFDFHYSWIRLLKHQGYVQIDSLVETTDSVRRVIPFLALTNGDYIFKLDTTYGHRRFELYSQIHTCQKDTIKIEVGNKCDGYPTDWMDSIDVCVPYVESAKVFFFPEVPEILGKFTAFPDSAQTEPCDTFRYEAQFKNSNLGYLINPHLFLKEVPGLELVDAQIRKENQGWMQLGPYIQNGLWYDWDLSPTFDTSGFKGFSHVGENVFYVQLLYSGSCDIANGSAINLEVTGKDLCEGQVSSGQITSAPLLFKKDTSGSQDSLYNLHLAFSGDTLCGKEFRMRATLTSQNPLTFVPGQQLHFSFKKELGYVPNSYVGIKNVWNRITEFRRVEDYDQLILDIPVGLIEGDSIVFELALERTCIGLCKHTDFYIDMNTPKNVPCATYPSGQCDILTLSQRWTYDSVVIAPYYNITSITGNIERLPGGMDVLNTSVAIKNNSTFSNQSTVIIGYYQEINGNGRLDTSDNRIGWDTMTTNLTASASTLWTSKMPLNPPYSCAVWVVISPKENPCLCLGDTLLLAPIMITPLRDTVLTCYNQAIQIGFDSIEGYTYQWHNHPSLSRLDQSITRYNNPSPIGKNSSETEILELEARLDSGCHVIDTVVVIRYRPELSAHVLDSVLCHGDQNARVMAMLDGAVGRPQYQWSTGDTSHLLTGLGKGLFSVTAIDDQGCADTLSVNVTEPDSIQNQVLLTSDYNGFNIPCTGENEGWVQLDISGGTPSYSVEWNGKSTTSTRIDSLSEGWNVFTLRDKNGCAVKDSVFLTAPPPMEAMAEATKAGCNEESLGTAQAQGNGGVGGYQYQWSDGQTGDSISGLEAGSYQVTITDANGCVIIDTVIVEKLPDPNIRVNILDTTIDYGDQIRLFAQSNADSGIYIWYPEEIVSCDTCHTTVVSPTEYITVQVRVIDKYGCEAWATISIQVRITKRVWAPNAFTPNGDNINDGFTLFGNETLEEIEKLLIFDRWGELVYQNERFEPGKTDLGWDGILNGEKMNPAVFAWWAVVRFVDGERRMLSGNVTLVR